MKPSATIAEQAAFWALPIASVADLARVLGMSPQALGKTNIPVIKIGGQKYCKPIELAHSFRAIRPEVSA